MDKEEIQSVLHGLISDCVSFTDSELSPDRAKATDYYKGEPFGNEEEGRSQVVLTPVRDTVRAVLPSLLRVFFGPDRVVEFVPSNAEQMEAAAQATDYVQYVFAEDNAGFLKTLSVLKDGLVRKLGIFKWGWDESQTTKAYRLTGVPQSELEVLAADDDVTLVSVADEPPDPTAQPAEPQMPGMPPAMPEPTFTVELTRKENNGTARVWTVPPEEFIFNRTARTIDDALLIGHRMEKTRGELIAMGVDEADIDEYGSPDSSLNDSIEDIARRPVASDSSDPEAGEANEKTLFIEGYARIDIDGDKVAELVQIWALGPNYQIIKQTPVDEAPFAIFCPDPEPHTIVGGSFADLTMDVQKITSSLARSTLDSLAASIYPRTAYVEGQVSVEDILNTAIGAPIRQHAPGMVQTFAHDFAGREALPILAYFDDIIEKRTGQNKGAMGLDADALQSSTRAAVGAAVSASQAQSEMLARIFAESTLKPLFRGLLKLLVKNQPKERVVRLRGHWVPVDPRVWDANMDVTVNVALGSGLVEDKVATLVGIAEKQEGIFALMGPQNPVVTLAQYAHTLKRIAELQGYKNSTEFFNDVDPNWQPPQQAPQPTPEQVLAQAQMQMEQMKTERELTIKQAELELRRQEMMFEHERALNEAAAANELKRYELELKYHAQITGAQLDADVQRERNNVDGTLAAHQQAHAQAIAEHEQQLAAEQQAHDQQMAEQQQQQEAAAAQQQAAQQGATE